MVKRGRQSFTIQFLGGPDYATRMTCREAGCVAERDGWVMALDIADEKYAKAAQHIRDDSGRRFVELPSEGGVEAFERQAGALTAASRALLGAVLSRTPTGMAVFVFPPGQQCFRIHEDREVIFAHDRYVHTKPLDFNEDFNIEADRIDRAIRRG